MAAWSGGVVIGLLVMGATEFPSNSPEPAAGKPSNEARREASSSVSSPGFNRLIHEKSPYLQQHARNPVDWYPWGEEAFAKARKEGKPIFLSIGYSTCHWCHVMERESFEDAETAAILNRRFVSIKVDREERPDVDKVYMIFVQASTGGGGWPMSVWLTPDLKPFFGGTYYPPEDRSGRPGFKHILLRIAEAWERDPRGLAAAGEEVIRQLRQAAGAAVAGPADLETGWLDRTYEALKASYDPRDGGFGGAPKFPRPSAPNFLLRYYARGVRSALKDPAGTPPRDALDMPLFTLRKMADGGIHDRLGGGFHRYAVDARWHVPHFEKMLYDQGQLVCTYLDAWQITHEAFFADVARDVLDYVRRDMTDPAGGFLSAEDADSPLPANPSERAEGAFYVWESNEIGAVLGETAAAVFNFHYGVEEEGNVRNDPQGEFGGKNVLIVSHTLDETAARFKLTPDGVREALADARAKLFEARRQRPRPRRDDKIVTAWNGLMISGFARAYQALADARDLAAATAAARFIRARLYRAEDGILLRRYRAGEAAIEGFADDYAFLIQGLLDLYEASFDVEHLTWALALQKKQDALFWDDRTGGYFDTTGGDADILLRTKESYDGAEPSASSVALQNLLRLAQMTDDAGLRGRAERTFAAFAGTLRVTPHAMPQMMAAFDFYLDKPMQIVIAGKPEAKDTLAMRREIHSHFVPNKVLLLADGGKGQAVLAQHLKFIETVRMIGGKATAYVCADCVCKAPTTDVNNLAQLMGGRGYQSVVNGH